MKVKDVMQTRYLVTVREDDDLVVARQLMRWRHLRHVPVMRAKRVVGVLTEQNLLRYRAEMGIASGGHETERGAAKSTAKVKTFMTTPAVTISPEADLSEATTIMIARGIGSLPVVDVGKLVGLLTATDLVALPLTNVPEAEAPPGSLGSEPTVAEAMRREVLTIRAEKPLLEAVGLMADHGFRHLPVLDAAGRLVGIVSDRDVRSTLGDPMQALHSDREGVELLVSDVMSVDVKTVDEGTPLGEAAAHLAEEHIGALPVVDAGRRLVGILSYVDVIRSLSRLAHLSAA